MLIRSALITSLLLVACSDSKPKKSGTQHAGGAFKIDRLGLAIDLPAGRTKVSKEDANATLKLGVGADVIVDGLDGELHIGILDKPQTLEDSKKIIRETLTLAEPLPDGHVYAYTYKAYEREMVAIGVFRTVNGKQLECRGNIEPKQQDAAIAACKTLRFASS